MKARLWPGLFLVCLLLAGCAPEPEAEPSISVTRDSNGAPIAVEVAPLSADERRRLLEQPEALEVRTRAAIDDPSLPAIAGRLVRSVQGVSFRPSVGFSPGVSYTATFIGADGKRLEHQFVVSAPGLEAPRVTALHPSVEHVPANLLRLYVHFSTPMLPRVPTRAVRLDRLDGAATIEVEEAFVEIETGLWDGSNQRLTLFFHPGRLKRGVGPNQVLGPPLEPGNRYRLSIGPGLESAAGAEMVETFHRELTVGPDDRSTPQPETWSIEVPQDPRAALRVAFGEPLDRALAERSLFLEESDGSRVEGASEIGAGDASWSFEPARPWQPGQYFLVVMPLIEDLAGNKPSSLFDREETDEIAVSETREAPIQRLPLTIDG